MLHAESLEQFPHSLDEPTGRSGPRSRRGCWTCRSPRAKKRCDEQRPKCGRCLRLKLPCDYTPRQTLAQRRRTARKVSQEEQNALELHDQAASRARRSSLSAIRLARPSTAACSLSLSNTDHEAIRFFRTAFAKFQHTKNPDYSLFSIMFNIAQEEPMIMHMVISLGLRYIDLRRPVPEADQESDPALHYTASLGLLAEAISPENGSYDLDSIYTVLWLMMLYDQQFGDTGYKHYSTHLAGASRLLQYQQRQLSQLSSPTFVSKEQAPVLAKQYLSREPRLSLYAARILVWISLLDAGAATFGVDHGGIVNTTLFTLILGNLNSTTSHTTPVHTFSRLHKYSNPLYRLTWGDSYPQTELLDDVENRNIFALLGQCAQLRFMCAQLVGHYHTNPVEATCKARDVNCSIEQVGDRFAELMEVASELSPHTDNSHRLVANIRSIVPIYYAVILDFMRITAFDQPLGDRQRHALREIMNLSYQSFKHDGDTAMIRVAWPLFIAALETDDLLHRDWVLDRFAALGRYGKNFDRAHRFLQETIPIQQQLARRVDLRVRLKRGEQFVLA